MSVSSSSASAPSPVCFSKLLQRRKKRGLQQTSEEDTDGNRQKATIQEEDTGRERSPQATGSKNSSICLVWVARTIQPKERQTSREDSYA